jgi:hypothetical protein
MGDERLSYLLLLHKSSDIIISKVDLEKVMKVWYTSKKGHRITLY